MGRVKIGISLYEGIPAEVYTIVRQRGEPTGAAHGEFQRYWMDRHYAERIQAIMSRHVMAQEADAGRRRIRA